MTPDNGVYEHVSALIRSLHGPTRNVSRPPTPIHDETPITSAIATTAQVLHDYSTTAHTNNISAHVHENNFQDELQQQQHHHQHQNHHDSHLYNLLHFPAALLGNHHNFRIPMLTITEPEIHSTETGSGHDHLNRFFHFATRRHSNTVL